MSNWQRDAFEHLPSLHYKVISLTANADRIIIEYIRSIENEEDMLVAESLLFTDNKIVTSRAFHR